MNPVIIDQNYNPYIYDSASNAVEVSDVTYRNIHGTSSKDNTVELNCDPNIGCNNIVVDQINITRVDGGEPQASCTNAHGTCSSCFPTVSCLSDDKI